MRDIESYSTIKTTIQHLDAVASELAAGYLSIFAGAGTSLGSGYVDWKQLMNPIIDQLGINPNIDLTKAAQYYENEFGRHGINLIVNDEFHKGKTTENRTLNQITDLPVQSVWTTNYDSLLEDSYTRKGKIADVKIKQEQFKYHVPNCDVTIYKMHGDKNYPDDVVITKNDYETYDSEREVFTKALSVELITHTFLFIGFSFSDPNLDRIISVVRHTFKQKAPKNHYCFMKRVCKSDSIYHLNRRFDYKQYLQDSNYQALRIRDMRKYGIQTILVDNFSQINDMLDYIKYKYTSNYVFVSGSYPRQLEWDSPSAKFIQRLSQALVERQYKIFSGFGTNVGNYLVLGAYQGIRKYGLRNINSAITIYPLVSLKESDGECGQQNIEDIRKAMIDTCGIFISIFGKTKYEEKHDVEDIRKIASGTLGLPFEPTAGTDDIKIYDPKIKGTIQNTVVKLTDDGMISEYKIARKLEKIVIACGFTGYTSKYVAEFEKIKQPSLTGELSLNGAISFDTPFEDKTFNITAAVNEIIARIEKLQAIHSNEMEEKLMQSIQSEEIEMRKIFISFHYAEGRAIAKRIRNVLRDKENYVVNDEETIQQKNSDIIKDWINEKLQGTDTTVLVWTDNIFKSEFVHYEIAKSIERHNAFVILTAASDWCGSCIISQLREKKWIPETVPDDYFVVGEWNNMEKSLIPLLDMAFAKKRLSN